MKQTQSNDNIIKEIIITPFGSTGGEKPIFDYITDNIDEQIKIIDDILNHKFNIFTAESALMVGNTKLSTVKKEEVIRWEELADYLIKTKSQLTDIWKKANKK